MASLQLRIYNPLPETLAHYESQLLDMLRAAGVELITHVAATSVERSNGLREKAKRTLRTMQERLKLAFGARGGAILVLWPVFGYFDALTWILAARRMDVFLVVHDPTPLRHQYGHAQIARILFRHLVRIGVVTPICHTRHAAEALEEKTGVVATVVPHPIRVGEPLPGTRNNTVCVLGQYKQARALEPLVAIASAPANAGVEFEIHGRGWPDVAGWDVDSSYISDEAFAQLLDWSAAIIIPYTHFYQSNVASRCLEASVPIVAPAHPHIIELYGEDWPGIVTHDEDWPQALHRTLQVTSAEIAKRHKEAAFTIQKSWTTFVLSNNLIGA